ncbi:MAG: hypothetical protein ACK4YP_22735 [Myxococcota bacterium]
MLLLLACAGAPADTAAAETGCVTSATWQNFGDGFFASYCRACHSATTPERYGAPVGIDFDTEEQVRVLESSVRHTVLDAGTMPPGGGLLPDDLALLEAWLDCGG